MVLSPALEYGPHAPGNDRGNPELRRKEVPIYERFFVGGWGTVRGFEYGWAGPLDENDDPQGARKMVALNTEILFPLSREVGLRGPSSSTSEKGLTNSVISPPSSWGRGRGFGGSRPSVPSRSTSGST